ncbi:Gfo/Idh/MocA family protein [Cohnella nanjingensis]|uniref:Gfo/Idh/MocA family oxidoreductase n=1 Tax=Cohnella nanjingensis TaxID=1387779 RepID=A0A7X0RQC8_9BACL|nr:Gfo/Idh/MocA family oxidoreductase [Cohnella nanjingensis]MBB6670485.1 Gfo/Idh/MocA family oxidoreductase [Cohnella nanjingensis]
MVKIGLIGAGFMGGMHAACYEALLRTLDFKVTAVADDNPQKAETVAAKFGAQAFASAAELIARGDVTAVDICLPTYLHAETAIAAMNRGLDVFIEKPVCLNEQEAERLLAAQRQSGVKAMVGHVIRYWPEYVELKALADSGIYGKVVSAVFNRISPKPDWAWQGWLDDPDKSGSAALDLHIHDVDFVRYLLGDPDRISSMTVSDGGAKNHIFSLYEYPDAVVSLEGGWDYPAALPFEMSYRVKFERATVLFSSAKQPTLAIYEENGGVVEKNLELDVGTAAGGGNISSLGAYYSELRYFVERLVRDEPIAISTLQDGCDSLKLTLREIANAQSVS